jgi:hypothetical protein
MHRFPKTAFEGLSESAMRTLCDELATFLSQRISLSSFHRDIYKTVEELRSAGHDLWSQDEGDDFQVWGPNYDAPSGPGLIVSFRAPDSVTVEPVGS